MRKANPKSTVAPKVCHLNLGWFVVYSGIPEMQRTSIWLWRFNPLLLRLLGGISLSLLCLHSSWGSALDLAPPLCVGRLRVSFWEVWGLLPVFGRCSVGVVPHVDVVLMYLWGGRWSPRLTSLPSWRHPPLVSFRVLLRLSSSQIITKPWFKIKPLSSNHLTFHSCCFLLIPSNSGHLNALPWHSVYSYSQHPLSFLCSFISWYS